MTAQAFVIKTRMPEPPPSAEALLTEVHAAMEEIKHPWMTGQSTPAPVLVLQFENTWLGHYQRVARALRAAGIGAEVYPEVKRLKAQFEYADKRGFKVALIAGSEEFAAGVWKIKDLTKREEMKVPEAEVVGAIRKIL